MPRALAWKSYDDWGGPFEIIKQGSQDWVGQF
jgi:hypothetical protein